MGRLVAALVLTSTLLLAGCGADTPEGASDPTGTPTGEPEPSEPEMSIGDPEQEPTVVALITADNAGGKVSTRPVPVGTPKALAGFSRGLDDGLAESLERQVRAAQVPDGQDLLAAVVGVGCDTVTDVDVRVGDGAPRLVTSTEKARGKCTAPVTTVALVTAIL